MAALLGHLFELCPLIGRKIASYLDPKDLEILATALSSTLRGRFGRYSISFRRQIELAGGYSSTYHVRQVNNILRDIGDLVPQLLVDEGRKAKFEYIGELMELGERHLRQASLGSDTPELRACADAFYAATNFFLTSPLTCRLVRYTNRLEGVGAFRPFYRGVPVRVRTWVRGHSRRINHPEGDPLETNLAFLFED